MTAKQKTKYYLLIAAAVLLCVLCLYLFSDRVNSARETLQTADSILQDACASHSLPAGLKEKLRALYEALRSAPDLQAGAAELEGFQLTH